MFRRWAATLKSFLSVPFGNSLGAFPSCVAQDRTWHRVFISKAVGCPPTTTTTLSNHPRSLFTSLISASPGTKRCSKLRPLVYQRSTEHRRAAIIIIIIIAGTQHGEAAAAQPPSRAAAANQRPGFSSASRRERAVRADSGLQRRRRRKVSSVRDAQLCSCEFTQKVEDQRQQVIKADVF